MTMRPFPPQGQWQVSVLIVMEFLFHTILWSDSIQYSCRGYRLTAVVFPCWATVRQIPGYASLASRPDLPPPGSHQTSRSLLLCHPPSLPPSLNTNLLSSSQSYHSRKSRPSLTQLVIPTSLSLKEETPRGGSWMRWHLTDRLICGFSNCLIYPFSLVCQSLHLIRHHQIFQTFIKCLETFIKCLRHSLNLSYCAS